MSEWGIALIAAGSAILGSITTGFFAWKAGHRQAAAAEAAGAAQASALIATVQATLDEQRRARAEGHRRQVYLEFLDAAQIAQMELTEETISAVFRADNRLELEGPEAVSEAAHAYAGALRDNVSDEGRAAAEDARCAYIEAVRQALNDT
ncbi:hypothetical protein [Streptomyces sp. NPDC054975]